LRPSACVVVLCLTSPASSVLAATHARLLEGQSLRLSFGATDAGPKPVLSAPPLVPAGEPEPPPPPVPVQASTADVEEEVPGYGGFYGFTITGGAMDLFGAVYVLLYALPGMSSLGAVPLAFGVAHLVVGTVFLFLGYRKYVQIQEWRETHRVARAQPATVPATPLWTMAF
jgi:hypothetical protein